MSINTQGMVRGKDSRSRMNEFYVVQIRIYPSVSQAPPRVSVKNSDKAVLLTALMLSDRPRL